MSSATPTDVRKRKTPGEASDFEREQLRFFLSQGDLATTLATLNPSLAWLPFLSQMKLVQNERQLAFWIERNFSDIQSVRDVVANLRFFGPETATLLDHSLTVQGDHLDPLLVKCWRLIIRHMSVATHSGPQNDWFDIEPRIKHGETSADVFQRLADALRPKLRVGKRFSFGDKGDEPLRYPWQLMSIDYEVEDGLTAQEVLSALPPNLEADKEARLLTLLTIALSMALEDATDAGVEGDVGYGTSDSDVPSVAGHEQNRDQKGFHVIVRVIADLWERLASKAPAQGVPFVYDWRDRPYRLMRRLALFASANAAVPAETAADTLTALPQGEVFLTSSTVEVFRLIRKRWREFPRTKQDEILRRFCEGPPREWFTSDASIDEHLDRSRFDTLGELAREGFALGAKAEAVLAGIRERWPQWELRPPSQAGFHVWVESGWRGEGDALDFEGVPDAELASEAERRGARADLRSGDGWRALCLSDPDRALRGLDAAAGKNDWSPSLWHQLLWANKAYVEPGSERRIAELLLEFPVSSLGKIAPAASFWLNERAATIDEPLLWRLWDRVADVVLGELEDGAGD